MKKTLFIISLILIASVAFSQQDDNIITFRPNSPQQSELEKKIMIAMDDLKNSGYFSHLLIYFALRKEDLSLCPSNHCQSFLRDDLMHMRYEGEGRCAEINDAFHRELCVALKSDNCAQLSGWKRDYCQGMIDGDVDALLRIRQEQDKGVSKEDSRNSALLEMGIFWGYRHYSPLACERYIKNSSLSLNHKLCCGILFSQDATKTMADLVRDLAIFNLSHQEGNTSLCDSINNDEIKKACLNTRLKSLGEILR